MKFYMEKPFRLHRYFIWYQVDGFWWNEKTSKWVCDSVMKITDDRYSSCKPCRTLRAFRRELRKHPVIRGRARLVNRYYTNGRSYDILG